MMLLFLLVSCDSAPRHRILVKRSGAHSGSYWLSELLKANGLSVFFQ